MSRTRRKNNVNTSRSFVTRVPATETAKRIALAGAVSAALGIGLTVRRVEVEGESMLPALESGDRLLVLRGCRVRTGDVAVVRDPRDPARLVVKRVASVAGHECVVRGDNPDASTDSRVFGPVRRRAVIGRAVYRYWPPARRGTLTTRPPAGLPPQSARPGDAGGG